MDDLASAIADARYMGERNSEGLDPMVPIDYPSEEELASFRSSLESKNPSAFSLKKSPPSPRGYTCGAVHEQGAAPNADVA